MPSSRVIRIDDQVWAELQRRAQPLEDTPNSVLRRVFGLKEPRAEPDGADTRVTRLMGQIQDLAGETPVLEAVRKGYSLLSSSGESVAYIRPQKERLRIEASKERAVHAGASGWDRERPRGRADGEASTVRWYIPDGDEEAWRRVAAALAKLWVADS